MALDFFGCVRKTEQFIYKTPQSIWKWFKHSLEASSPHLTHTATSLGIGSSVDAWIPTDSLGVPMKYLGQAAAHFSGFFRIGAHPRERFAQFSMGVFALTLMAGEAYAWLYVLECLETVEGDENFEFCRWLAFGNGAFNTLLSFLTIVAATHNNAPVSSVNLPSPAPVIPQPTPETEIETSPELEIEMIGNQPATL